MEEIHEIHTLPYLGASYLDISASLCQEPPRSNDLYEVGSRINQK